MLYAVYRLARPDPVGVVGICVVVKGLELSALLPRQSMAQVRRRVALRVIAYRLLRRNTLYVLIISSFEE